MTAFDKSSISYPYKTERVSLETCYVSPIRASTADAIGKAATEQAQYGSGIVGDPSLNAVFREAKESLARLLTASPSEISLHPNTELALGVIATRFPFKDRDSVITLSGEYPSAYSAFAERKGLEIIFLEGCKNSSGRVISWSPNELDAALTRSKASLVALGHVIYRSGFMVDVPAIRSVCNAHGATLVIDAAQSAGVFPIDVSTFGADAIAFPLWKGCEGPLGAAALWTSPRLTTKLITNDSRSEAVKSAIRETKMKRIDLNDARMFETSTLSRAEFAGVREALNSGALQYPGKELHAEVMRLQTTLLEMLDREYVTPIFDTTQNRGTFLGAYLPKHEGGEQKVVDAAKAQKVMITQRDGILRLAPQYHCSETELQRAADVINDILRRTS